MEKMYMHTNPKLKFNSSLPLRTRKILAIYLNCEER